MEARFCPDGQRYVGTVYENKIGLVPCTLILPYGLLFFIFRGAEPGSREVGRQRCNSAIQSMLDLLSESMSEISTIQIDADRRECVVDMWEHWFQRVPGSEWNGNNYRHYHKLSKKFLLTYLFTEEQILIAG